MAKGRDFPAGSRDCTDSHWCGGDDSQWGSLPSRRPECEFLSDLADPVSLTIPWFFQQNTEHLGFLSTPVCMPSYQLYPVCSPGLASCLPHNVDQLWPKEPGNSSTIQWALPSSHTSCEVWASALGRCPHLSCSGYSLSDHLSSRVLLPIVAILLS